MIESVFKTGSTTPPAMLFDAFDYFEKKSPKADELMRALKSAGQLATAVTGCLQAAADEPAGHQPQLQRALLKAAAFGKSFLDLYDASLFVSTCKTFRILIEVIFNH